MKTKLTKNCFKGSNIAYRDSDIDSWLPKTQSTKIGKSIPTTFDTEKTFKEAFGENPDTFSLVEIENLINRTDKGEDTELRTDGRGNLFPVKSNDGVAVVHVYRVSGRWNVSVICFDDGDRWSVERRFFSRNGLSDTSVSHDTSVEKAIEIVKKAAYKVIKEI